jgi:putative transposase
LAEGLSILAITRIVASGLFRSCCKNREVPVADLATPGSWVDIFRLELMTFEKGITMSAASHYPTDLTDEQWDLLQSILPPRAWHPGGRGRPPWVDTRHVVDAILYLHKTACQGRMLPPDFGNWRTIYGYFKRWPGNRTWATLLERLRQLERRCQGRQAAPSAGRIDSQSLKSATQSEEIGFDGNKKIKGRKRHLLVDTRALIIAVVVTDAGTDDRQGLVELLTEYFADGVKRLRQLGVDGAYPAQGLEEWVRGLKQTHKIDLEATMNQSGKGFQVVPWRWAVERTFAWLLNDRRHSRDYPRLTANSAAMIQISMIRLLLKRLA